MNLMAHKHAIFMVMAVDSTLSGTADCLTTQSKFEFADVEIRCFTSTCI